MGNYIVLQLVSFNLQETITFYQFFQCLVHFCLEPTDRNFCLSPQQLTVHTYRVTSKLCKDPFLYALESRDDVLQVSLVTLLIELQSTCGYLISLGIHKYSTGLEFVFAIIFKHVNYTRFITCLLQTRRIYAFFIETQVHVEITRFRGTA